MADDEGVSIGDVTIYKDDLESVEPRQWLRDNIIAYYFESHIKPEVTGEELEKRILVLDPWGVFALQFFSEPEEYEGFIEGNQPKDKDFVFMPINNNQSLDKIGGGSHWTFLLYNRIVNEFWYFDSSYDSDKIARRTAEQFLKTIHFGAKEEDQKNLKVNLKTVKAPSQKNGYDCGMYLCCFALYVLKWIKQVKSEEDLKSIQNVENFIKVITPEVVGQNRKDIRESLNKKIKEATLKS